MCLAAIAIAQHPRYRWVVAANRDEFHARPSSAVAAWAEDANIVGGRDLRGGGSWMAADRSGRFALVTNIRRATANGGLSRGHLVRNLLLSKAPIATGMDELLAQAGAYSPFNLLAGDAQAVRYLNSDAHGVLTLDPATHVLSNATLNTAWPKVRRLSLAMSAWCQAGDAEFDGVFAALGDTEQPPDADLPDTGIGIQRERFLSAAFIVGDVYGTRCSSVLSLDYHGELRLIERRYAPMGQPIGQSELRWPSKALD